MPSHWPRLFAPGSEVTNSNWAKSGDVAQSHKAYNKTKSESGFEKLVLPSRAFVITLLDRVVAAPFLNTTFHNVLVSSSAIAVTLASGR